MSLFTLYPNMINVMAAPSSGLKKYGSSFFAETSIHAVSSQCYFPYTFFAESTILGVSSNNIIEQISAGNFL